MQTLARHGKFSQRLHRHLRAQVRTANADIDHVGDALVGAHLFGIGQHGIERFVHLRELSVPGSSRFAGRTRRLAQQKVHHRPLLGVVDGLTGKHGVAQHRHTALAGQALQQGLGGRFDQVFRQVGKDMRRLLTESFKTRRVGRKSLAQVKGPGGLRPAAKVGLQLRPGRRAVAACEPAHTASIS